MPRLLDLLAKVSKLPAAQVAGSLASSCLAMVMGGLTGLIKQATDEFNVAYKRTFNVSPSDIVTLLTEAEAVTVVELVCGVLSLGVALAL